jgi:hypothetical protein
MCGFLDWLSYTAKPNKNAFQGRAHPYQQHHWTTRISGWFVVIISPVYSLAPHSGPVISSWRDTCQCIFGSYTTRTVFI